MLSNSTEKGEGQKKFIDPLLEKKRSSGVISGVFWSRGVIYGMYFGTSLLLA
jgi:hypothetical protein